MVAEETTPTFIRFEGLIFYFLYLAVFWPFIYFMYQRIRDFDPERRSITRWLVLANAFLAAGDTIAAIGYSLGYFKIIGTDGYGTTTVAGFTLQTAVLGVIATSLTMSCYYLFLALYYRDRFHGGRNDVLMFVIYVFFLIRIVLHFNPQNVWFSTLLPENTPNYSAWLRNAPLFLYGLLTTFLIGWKAYQLPKVGDGQFEQQDLRTRRKYLLLMVMAILVSYLFYTLDVIFSFVLPLLAIGLTYILKTIAYMLAAWFMYKAEIER